MPILTKYREQLHNKYKNHPEYLSGYQYAEKKQELWHALNTEGLHNMADTYFELFSMKDNWHSLGMAIYLHDLAEARQVGKAAPAAAGLIQGK